MLRRGSTLRERHCLWSCRSCQRPFSFRLGTIMERTGLLATVWAYALWHSCVSPVGVSARDIELQTGASYISSNRLVRRLRWASFRTGSARMGEPPRRSSAEEPDAAGGRIYTLGVTTSGLHNSLHRTRRRGRKPFTFKIEGDPRQAIHRLLTVSNPEGGFRLLPKVKMLQATSVSGEHGRKY